MGRSNGAAHHNRTSTSSSMSNKDYNNIESGRDFQLNRGETSRRTQLMHVHEELTTHTSTP